MCNWTCKPGVRWCNLLQSHPKGMSTASSLLWAALWMPRPFGKRECQLSPPCYELRSLNEDWQRGIDKLLGPAAEARESLFRLTIGIRGLAFATLVYIFCNVLRLSAKLLDKADYPKGYRCKSSCVARRTEKKLIALADAICLADPRAFFSDPPSFARTLRHPKGGLTKRQIASAGRKSLLSLLS